MKLRPYQRAACDAYYEYLRTGGLSAVIELATGCGKSLVLANVAKELIERYPSLRILAITHSRELISQNFKELMRLWPRAPAGVNSAGLGRRDWQAQILFAGVQSIHRDVDLLGPVDLVIVDEAHLISKKATGMYQKVLNQLRDITDDLRVLGLSATPFRLDSGRLDEGEDRLFEKTVFKYGIADGIKQEYLSPLISKAMIGSEIDTAGVKVQGGEFVAAQLETAAMRGDNVERAADEMIRYGQDRRAWLAFCTGIKHAEAVAEALRARGVPCESVTSDTPNRDAHMEAFRRGELRCLANVNCLTTGFNVPHVDMISLLRPTQSPGLAIQMLGRGTRLADGKSNCLVLDFAKILSTHGPVDQMAPPERKRSKKEKTGPLVKICPECNALEPLTATQCEQCGHVFERAPRQDAQHDGEADSSVVVLSDQEKPKWVKVTAWRFSIHKKDGKPDTLRVKYLYGLNGTINEFWCFEHGGWPAAKAAKRWSELRCYDFERSFFSPQTTAEAFEHAASCLECPAEVMIRRAGKYYEIVKLKAHNEAVAA